MSDRATSPSGCAVLSVRWNTPAMTQRRRSRTVLALGSLLTVGALLTACTGDPEPGPTPTSRTATEPGDESGAPAPSAGTPGSTPESTAEGTPGPNTRRTTEQDVELTGPGVPEVAEGYARAAVPIDAWPVARVLLDAGDEAVASAAAELAEAGAPGSTVVTAHVEACALISAWALPHPERVVLGYEPHPSLTCVRAVDHTILAVVPTEGLNSEGAWSYGAAPEVQTQLRVGT